MKNMKKYIKKEDISISDIERELLGEILKSEKANLRVFPLNDKKEQVKYEKILDQLCNKLA